MTAHDEHREPLTVMAWITTNCKWICTKQPHVWSLGNRPNSLKDAS